MMKKLVLGLLTASAMLLSACDKGSESSQSALAPAPAPAPAKIVIGLDDNFPPMGFRDDRGELVGFDIDMAREAAKRMGLQAEFKPIDWSTKEAELAGKRVDLLWNGMTITEARKQVMNFSNPYMENHQIIIVKAGSEITDKAGLTGRVVGVQDGSSAVDAVEADTETADAIGELKKYADNVTALMDLAIGRVDAVVVDEVVGRYYVAQKPGEYTVLEDNFGTEEYGVGLRKEDTELQAKLQAALDAMKADGTSAKIAQQWFGADIVK